MDGIPFGDGFGDYSNFIAFTYDYTNAPSLALDNAGNIGVDVDFQDFLVSGSITPTPEPGSIFLLGSGLLGLAGLSIPECKRRALLRWTTHNSVRALGELAQPGQASN
jgi:hypothetical protein